MSQPIFSKFIRAVVVTMAAVMLALIVAQIADARVRRRHSQIKAPRYTQQGLAFSFAPIRASFDSELCGFDTPRGAGGVALGLSLGLSPHVSLFGSLTGITYDSDDWEEWSVGYADLGVKFSFLSHPHQRTQAYLSAALGRAALTHGGAFSNDADREYVGGSLRLALGLDYFITQRVLLFGEVGTRVGEFDRFNNGGNDCNLFEKPEFSSAGLLVGLRFKL